MVRFEGKHKAIINLFLNKLADDVSLNQKSKFEKCLINATAIKASNKIELYGSKIIKTEIEYLNNKFNLNIAYEDFILMDEPYISLWEKYSGFKDLTIQLFTDLTVNFKKIREYYNSSYGDLKSLNFISCSNDIDDIFFLNGESHDGNKNVVVFYKNKKPCFCLKLRDIKLEKITNEFIGHFSKTKLKIDSWVSAVYIDKEDHGWVKWIERVEFTTEKEVESYYFNFGVLLSVCSVLNITDLHYENIIANFNPVPIDLETALHCHDKHDIYSRVIGTYLLPHTLKYASGVVSKEHSGIGNIFELQQYEKNIIRGNTVELNGKMKSSLDFIDIINRGFIYAYQKINNNKDTFISFLEAAKENTHRIIFNSTEVYYNYVNASMHPELMRCQVKRKNYIRQCLLIDGKYHGNKEVLEYEIESIMNGDVPRFTCDVNGTIIYYRGLAISKLTENVYDGYSFVKNTINELSQDCIESESLEIIGLLEQCHGIVSINNLNKKTNDCSLTSIKVLMANKISKYLQRIAERDSSLKLYIAFSDNGLEYRQPPLDIFNGIAGMLYFNSKFNIVNKDTENRIHKVYLEFINSINYEDELILGGAYIGYLSCIMPLMMRYKTLSIEEKETISNTVDMILNIISKNKEKHPGGCSLLGGLSGLLAITSMYFFITKDIRWKKMSVIFFKKLLSFSEEKGEILIFPYGYKSKHHLKSLSGLSHGQAGIAYAIALYGLIFNEYYQECTILINKTINFEIENYDYQLMNWKDYRLDIYNEEAIHDFSWSHGGAGIVYCMSFILEFYKIESLEKFYSSLNLNKMFLKNINGRKEIKNYTISNGHIGAILIFKRLNAGVDISLSSIIENENYKFNALTGLGLLKGISGELLSLMELSGDNESNLLPLLPHEFFSLFKEGL